MNREKDQLEIVSNNGRTGHPLALGLLAGAAVGLGLGMLLAPRKGAELRHAVAVRAGRIKDSAATGYRRSKDTAGHYAHRGHDAYSAARNTITHSAQETGRYVRDVAHAVTRKAHRDATESRLVTS